LELNEVNRHISSVVDNNEHHPALLGRVVIVAPSINAQTNLLTYLLWTSQSPPAAVTSHTE